MGCGCFGMAAALFLVFMVIGFFLDEDGEIERVYAEPQSAQEEIDQFAKQKLDALQKRSFASDVEYCGMIYEDRRGNLSSTPAFRGDDATCDIEFEYGGNLNPIASFHTHGAYNYDYDNEAPSLIDMEADIGNKVDGYIATPGGRMWRIDWRDKRAILICGARCLEQDPNYRPCKGYPVKSEYSLEGLRERIENDPDRC